MNAFSLGLRLLVVTAVAGLALGAAERVTREPIAREMARQRDVALREVLPAAQRFEPHALDLSAYPLVQDVVLGYDASGKPVGADITVSSNGYGGPVVFMVGIDSHGVVQGLKVTLHTETPGLGANAATTWFGDRFKGTSGVIEVVKGEVSDAGAETETETDAEASASKLEETGGKAATSQVQAITGATVTSSAVARGVNQALALFDEQLKEVLK